MLNFEYHGIRAGKYDTGQIEALNKEEAADKLKSQNIITWDLLKNVEFDEVWSEEFQAYYMVPKFSKAI